jgi:catechol 2,3-dioxygenase-like lactoylglutathione lyase family enzyme
MEKAIAFYSNILGYSEMVTDNTDVFTSYSSLPGGNNLVRRVVLKQKNNLVGGFGELLGPSQLELIQLMEKEPKKIFENRLWGDLGYIHLCFDVQGIDELREKCSQYGHAFTVDSAKGFDMGDAAGHFSYIEDPDGTLIEFVETHKVPILKKLGLYINLKKRNRHKVLPRWIINMLSLQRINRNI